MKQSFPAIKTRYIYIAALIWATVPVIIMLPFWFRWYYGIPAMLLTACGGFSLCRKISWECIREGDDRFTIGPGEGAVLIFAAIFLILCGIGGFLGQFGYDQSFRNAVLVELIDKPWPVVDWRFTDGAYLDYYFLFWIIPAIVGKIFSSYGSAQVAMFIYAWLGVSVTAIMIMRHCGRRRPLIGLLSFLFVTLDYVNLRIFWLYLGWHDQIYVGTDMFCAPTAAYNICFNYHQGIPSWLILMLMLRFRSMTGGLVFLFSLLAAMSPLTALAVGPLVLAACIVRLKDALTLPNLAGVTAGLLLFIFYAGNDAGSHLVTVFDTDYTPFQTACFFLGYIIFDFLVFFPFIWKYIRHDRIFWALLACTLPWMFLTSEYGNFDYGWKVPIAFTFYLMLQVLRYCAETRFFPGSVKSWAFVILMLVSLKTFHPFVVHGYNNISRSIPYGFTTENRSKSREGLLFSKEKNICFRNFIVEEPTVYSRFLMPRIEVPEGRAPSTNKTINIQ